MFARLLRQWTDDLVLCADGQPLPAKWMSYLAEHGIMAREERIEALEGTEGCLKTIHFASGKSLRRRAPGQHARSPLLEGLGGAYDEKGGCACDPDGKTNIPGAFVAGDVSRDVQCAIIAAAEAPVPRSLSTST